MSQQHVVPKAAQVAAFLLSCAAALMPGNATAGKFRVLHSFCQKSGCPDGQEPYAGVVADPAGNLYGTTDLGGLYSHGTVYELSPRPDHSGWTYRVLHSFCGKPGCTDIVPMAPLIVDVAGNLYGTTFGTGGPRTGTIFRLSPNEDRSHWSYTILHRFCREANCADGFMSDTGLTYAGAAAGLPYDGQSPLYGTTMSGGLFQWWYGLVYELKPSNDRRHWRYRVLYNFCQAMNCTDGQLPYSGLVMDAAGSLYGATIAGGTSNDGTVFRLSPSKGKQWGYSVLYSFCQTAGCPDGASPSDVALDPTGVLLGATGAGGQTGCGNSYGCGVLFRISENGDSWHEDVLHAFCSTDGCADGSDPSAAPLTAGVNIQFGTTYYGGGNNTDPQGVGGGVLLERADRFRVRYRFCALPLCADGAYPYGKLVADAEGHLFGVTGKGGAHGAGVIYEFTP